MKVKVALLLVIACLFIPGKANATTVGGHCPQYYPTVVNNWPNGAKQWKTIDRIIYRESRCRAGVINSHGCVGLMQICRGNHARMGTNARALTNPATNIRVAYRLCRESMKHGKSCWQPWSL